MKDERLVFWKFIEISNIHKTQELYKEGMPQIKYLTGQFMDNLKKILPKIHSHLLMVGITVDYVVP